MDKKLTLLPFSVFTILFGFIGFISANATHIAGTDVSYVNVGPNVYVVTFKTYSPCSNVAYSPTETLTYRAPGCINTASTLTLQLKASNTITSYCGTYNCAVPNFLPLDPVIERSYTGTLSFTSMCPNWILSNRNEDRSPTRSLTLGAQEWIYTNATINNVFTVTNNSPIWGELPNQVFGVD